MRDARPETKPQRLSELSGAESDRAAVGSERDCRGCKRWERGSLQKVKRDQVSGEPQAMLARGTRALLRNRQQEAGDGIGKGLVEPWMRAADADDQAVAVGTPP